MNESTDLGATLAAAIELLRQLPRKSEEISSAKQLIARWREGRAHADPRLVVNRQPGKPDVEYDLLLCHPQGGTLAMTWLGDSGLPWSVNYADHWAANFVVTVDDEHSLTVQQALMQLRMSGHADPGLMESMVNHLLLARLAEESEPPASESELQEAADSFRRARGLHSASETLRWLEEIRMPQVYFEEMLELAVRIRRAKHRIAAERLDAYFSGHRSDFDRIRVILTRSDQAVAQRLAESARGGGLFAALERELRSTAASRLEGSIQMRPAGELQPLLRDAALESIVGPYPEADSWLVAQVVAREPAVLDATTRVAVEECVCREWLAERRASARIRWHWL